MQLQIEMLTDDEQDACICADYWRQAEKGGFYLKINEIASKHGMLPQNVSKFVQKRSVVWLDEIRCQRCNEPYKFATRSLYQQRRRLRNRVCATCRETERRAISEKRQRVILEMRQPAETYQIDLANIDIYSKIYLLSTIKALTNETLTTIEPLEKYPTCTLSPDPSYDKQILRYLLNEHVLLVGLGTSLEVVVPSENDRFTINLGKCEFELNCKHEEITAFISDFFDNTNLDIVIQTEEFIELCKEIQLFECMAFFKKSLVEHQLYLPQGDKTKLVLKKCLEVFSVAQVYNFIWRAVKDSAAYYMRTRINRKHAANVAISNIARNMERALAYGWDVKQFHRDFSLPQSSLSHTAFNMILDTDDGGFEKPPHALFSIAVG